MRNPSNPDKKAQAQAMDLALFALSAGENAEEVARAALLAAGEGGATAAWIWLQPESGDDIRLTWKTGGDPEIPGTPPPPFLEELRHSAKAGIPAARTDTSGDAWICLVLPGIERTWGHLAVRIPETSGRAACAVLAAAVGSKVTQLALRDDLDRERRRSAGWFKTMDSQIRVLEQERQKFSALVNKTDAAIFVSDPEGVITWANPIMARRYSDLRSDLIGQTCGVLCGTARGACADCPILLVRNGNSLVHQERQEQMSGETRNIYLSAFPVRSPEGAVSEILVMLQDITDLETLRRSEARYQLLFERSADAIVMAEPDTLEIVMANRQAKDLLGFAFSEKERDLLLDLHPEEVRQGMRERYLQLALGRSIENVEVEVVTGDGDLLTCNACGTLFDLDGKNVLLVEFRDVTHLRRLQLELARADNLITLGTMNAGIAHEFKNRLAPLRAFAQMITMYSSEWDRIQTHAPLMIQEIDRLTGLVRDVLDYARPQEPDLRSSDFAKVVTQLVRELESDFETEILAKGIAVETRVPEDRVFLVDLDISQIRRAVQNLFKNSLEAMDSSSSTRSITIGVSERGRAAVLSVEDTGRGMEPVQHERMFDPFFTTKGTKGTGLGMCITKSLIEANGGAIHVSSEPGEGTRIDLEFPMVSPSTRRGDDSAPEKAGKRDAA